MTDSPDSKPTPTRRSGSSRSKYKKRGSLSYLTTLRDLLRRRMAVRVIAGTIVALGALVSYQLWVGFDAGLNTYLGLSLADNQQSALYAVGYPAAVRVDGNSPWVATGLSSEGGVVPGSAIPVVAGRPLFDYGQWAYRLPDDAQGQFTFAPDTGMLVRIACFQLQALDGACPPMLGVKVGDDEMVPYHKVGDPQRERMSGMSKLLYYDKLGVQYSLAQRRVYRIEIVARTGGAWAYWGQFFRQLFL